MSFKVHKPDEATFKRMSVESISGALNAFRKQRALAARPYNEQIEIYEGLLERKRKEVAGA